MNICIWLKVAVYCYLRILELMMVTNFFLHFQVYSQVYNKVSNPVIRFDILDTIFLLLMIFKFSLQLPSCKIAL